MLCSWVTYKLVRRYKMFNGPPTITSLALTVGSLQVISVKTAGELGQPTKEEFYYTDTKHLSKYIGPFRSLYEATREYSEHIKQFKAAYKLSSGIDWGVKEPEDNLIICDFKTRKYHKAGKL